MSQAKVRTQRVGERRQAQLEAILEIMPALRDLQGEVQEVVDGLEEHFSGTTRYEDMSDALEKLDTAVDALEDLAGLDFTSM